MPKTTDAPKLTYRFIESLTANVGISENETLIPTPSLLKAVGRMIASGEPENKLIQYIENNSSYGKFKLLPIALDYAFEKHRFQIRKDENQTPYFAHLLRVAAIAGFYSEQQEIPMVVALLHDTLEDTNATENELLDLFGDEITDCVLQLSEDKSLPKAESKNLYVRSVPLMSDTAAIVSFADKLDNIRSYILSSHLFGDSQAHFYGELIPRFHQRGFDTFEMDDLYGKLLNL